MEKGIRLIKLMTLVAVLSSCASGLFSDSQAQEEQARIERDQKQQSDLANIQALVNQNKNQEAISFLQKYRKAYPENHYYQASRIVEAQALYNMERFQEALDIYQETINLGPDKYPKLWAAARYQSTFCHEALGDQEKVIGILVGLEKSNAQLSDGVRMAELPARLAALYSELGMEKESMQYLDKAEKGLKFLINQRGYGQNKTWLAETLYRMGIATTQHLTEENFSHVVRGQRRNQVYLIKAMEQNDPTWSARALENLIQNYREFWNFTKIHWDTPEKMETRINKQKDLHALLSDSLYRKPVVPSAWNDYLKNYFDFATDLDQRLTKELYSGDSLTPMTQESLKLNDLKRPGKVEATRLLPEEKKAKPSKKVNKKDPNL